MTRSLTRTIGAAAVALACSLGWAGTIATAAPATGSAVVDSIGFLGTWTSDGPRAPRITLNPDGSYGGTDGCNSMTGRYTLVGNQIQLGLTAKTMMYCGEDVWFEDADRLQRDGDHLAVLDENGTRIGTLKREGGAPDPFPGLSSHLLHPQAEP